MQILQDGCPHIILQGDIAMTEKELKKLNRYQLLEMIILQTEQIADLEKQLENARRLLESQQIQVAQAGSIAEAALQLSGIFETAQSAADTYLANVKIHAERAEQLEANAQIAADQILNQARAEAESILENARLQADADIGRAQNLLEETTRRCTEKENAVNEYISSIREAFHLQFQNLDQIAKR